MIGLVGLSWYESKSGRCDNSRISHNMHYRYWLSAINFQPSGVSLNVLAISVQSSVGIISLLEVSSLASVSSAKPLQFLEVWRPWPEKLWLLAQVALLCKRAVGRREISNWLRSKKACFSIKLGKAKSINRDMLHHNDWLQMSTFYS